MYMCVCIAESSSNEEFTEWEQGWIQQISQDEEVFEENSTTRNDEPEISSVPSNNLKKYHIELEELKAYSLSNGYAELFINTQKTITNLKWVMSSNRGLMQTTITSFFNKTI